MYTGVPRTAPSCVRSSLSCRLVSTVADDDLPVASSAQANDGAAWITAAGGSARRVPEHLGQAPVHDVDLAEIADHDVGRLQIAMDHAARMGVGQGVADVDEDVQQPAQRVFLLGRRGFVAQLVQDLRPGCGP